jgi:hypothetical protein
MTFSSASVSAWDVDAVAATAAVAGGVRAGGKAACWRVAGARAGTAGAVVAPGAVVLAAAFAAGAAFLAVLGTTLRAIGLGWGNGTFGLAQASAANADNPAASASVTSALVPKAVRRRVDGVTAFLRSESFNRSSPRLYLIEYVDKILNTRGLAWSAPLPRQNRGQPGAVRPFAGFTDPL